MSKKNKNKREVIGKITSQQLFDMKKPKYDAYSIGTGIHGDKKYNRNRLDDIPGVDEY